jgi:hypothetical protein
MDSDPVARGAHLSKTILLSHVAMSRKYSHGSVLNDPLFIEDAYCHVWLQAAAVHHDGGQ